jgi:hypothetical protein
LKTNYNLLTALLCTLVLCAGIASAADKAKPKKLRKTRGRAAETSVELSATGEKLEAKYTAMMNSLKTDITKALPSVDDAKKFHTDDWNPSVQLMVMEALDREQEPHILYVTCDTCGQEFQSPEDVFSDGYRGCGGIAICACGIICRECLARYSCTQCYARVSEEDILDDEGRCEDCARGDLTDRQAQLQQLIINRAPSKALVELNDSVLCYMQYLEETFGKEEE